MVKSKCTIVSFSCRKNAGKITIKIAALDISHSVSVLQYLNETFDMGLIEGKVKIKIPNVLYDKMSINSDGEAKVTFNVEPENMPLAAEINVMQQPTFIIKGKNKGDDKNDIK